MGCCACTCLVRLIGGDWRNEKEMWAKDAGVGKEALKLIDLAFKDIDPLRILDVHVHLLGVTPSETGCYLHDNMDNCCKCQSYIKKRAMLLASGGKDMNNPKTDMEYVDRLVSLFEQFIPDYIQSDMTKKASSSSSSSKSNENKNEEKSKDYDTYQKNLEIEETKNSNNNNDEKKNNNNDDFDIISRKTNGMYTPRAVLLGLDEVYNKESGIVEPHHTSVHTPHEYVNQIVNSYPNIFVLGPSIHPYRKDALTLLKHYYEKGCKIIKWLPNSMGINPNDDKCNAFYDKLVEYNMILLTHTGAEHSLDDAGYTFNEYGNPLRLRKALDKGVKVIMAHCASEGTDQDIDDDIVVGPDTISKSNNNKDEVTSVDLFLRLMREKKYQGLLFGDISAITGFKRIGACVKIIQATDIHDRLIFGSDYPVPCLNMVVWYSQLARYNLISNENIPPLRDIYQFNPLLADFVLKRIMTITDNNGNVCKFSDKIFQRADLVDARYTQPTELKIDESNKNDKKKQ